MKPSLVFLISLLSGFALTLRAADPKIEFEVDLDRVIYAPGYSSGD